MGENQVPWCLPRYVLLLFECGRLKTEDESFERAWLQKLALVLASPLGMSPMWLCSVGLAQCLCVAVLGESVEISGTHWRSLSLSLKSLYPAAATSRRCERLQTHRHVEGTASGPAHPTQFQAFLPQPKRGEGGMSPACSWDERGHGMLLFSTGHEGNSAAFPAGTSSVSTEQEQRVGFAEFVRYNLPPSRPTPSQRGWCWLLWGEPFSHPEIPLEMILFRRQLALHEQPRV